LKAKSSSVEFEVDTSVYRLDALKKAAYRLSSQMWVELAPLNGAKVSVTLRAKGLHPLSETAKEEFCQEALDQELRELIATETAAIRNLLLAQAFSATSLLDPEGEEAEPSGDPLGISESQSALYQQKQ